MPAQKKTSLGLNQWIGSEYPKRIDFVEDNKIINDEFEKRVKYTDVATETKAGIITEGRIKEIAPQPNLSPYVTFTKGFRNQNDTDWFVRTNGRVTWASDFFEMYNGDNNQFMGAFHTNGSRAYYKVPNRNGGNWCEIMDNLDMAAMDSNIIYEIRMVGYVEDGINGKGERNGYVLTKVSRNHGDVQDQIKIGSRALQFRRNGQWLNAYFA